LGLILFFLRIPLSYLLGMVDQDLTIYLERIWGLSFFYSIIFFLWYVLYFTFHYFNEYNKSLKYEASMVQIELNNLKSQLNPHFIFNVLNSIQYYMKYVSAEKAQEYLKKFTSLIRINFDNARNNFNPLSKEISALEHYLSLEKIRFEDKMEFEIRVDKELDQDQILIPSLLIQPYAENAIWHGIMPGDKKGHILIEVRKEGEALLVLVRDNGVGINSSQKRGDHTSSALSLTKERLDILSRLTGCTASVTITDLKEKDPGKQGTEVLIQLPLLPPGTLI